ncbi:MAG: UDP-N-acetylmuramate:L-alanyl-gamma-D-glutamyl-meso-diaminopimelate ligase [Thermodesulfobacterium geofontis]|uniref:UDP-N-acetylmuramate:L-alanyl-gamma-D-glutamyl-meso-diaminopimelate ligase n=1 Tax=Thermodesulfobacterium geofontis TaxID=1295609 RepID=A0A2N7PN99_9BACT|nr:MAG: UDP-N-acetylmuramate:L-alanyl-gamma-D-glutamyl-meso-diaminopimelate ligase [Thermodesulfobacterium geofontis]
MKVYLIGIGGIGMCGVAGILKESGFEVYGSEKKIPYPPSSLILKKLNIPLYKPDSENIKKIKPDAVIVGNIAKSDDQEVLISQSLGIPLYSFPSFLDKFILKDKKVFLCAGTHGKTTVTALLSYTLEYLGFDPTYLVGGVLKHTELNYRKGEGDFAVIEGDEYPASFFDREPKFLYYHPFAVILTSLEYDHADVYPDMESLKEVFKKLIKSVPKEGIIVYNYDDKNLREVIESANPNVRIISYGKNSKADFVLLKSETTFEDLVFKNHVITNTPFKNLEFFFSIPGEYNALNALSVIALLYSLDLLKMDWKEAFKTFPGVKRRQEIVWADEKLIIVDDFAHHPTAVKNTLEELKKAIKPEKTVAIFEPRTNSSKRKIFQEDYVKSLSLADEIYLKIPPGLENIPERERIDINYILESLKNLEKKVFFLENNLDNNLSFYKIKKEKTLVVFMSSAYFKELGKLKNLILKPKIKRSQLSENRIKKKC